MLSSLVGEKEVFENKGNIFEDNESHGAEGNDLVNLFSMFDNPSQQSKEEPLKEEENNSEPDTGDESEKEDIPQIMEY